MKRPLVKLRGIPHLDDLAEVHDGDSIADVADNRQVVGDEDIGEVQLSLELDQQIEHLRLDGYIER